MSEAEQMWMAVVKAPQGRVIYRHDFEGVNPSELLRTIADSLDLSQTHGVQVLLTRVLEANAR